MIKQKDINKLKVCRAAIDKYRAFKAAYVKPEKEERVIITTAEGEKISIKVEPKMTAAIFGMNQVMKEQGFVNEKGEGSVAAFRDWYLPLIRKTYRDCNPISGYCNLCKLNPKCCAAKKPIILGDDIYDISREGMGNRLAVAGEIRSFCPKEGGAGFCIKEEDVTEPPAGIDFGWKI